MKCPYCNKEMQTGMITNGTQPVQWIPKGSKPSLFSFSKAENGVTLINDFSLLRRNMYSAEAYYCPECKVVLAHTQ